MCVNLGKPAGKVFFNSFLAKEFCPADAVPSQKIKPRRPQAEIFSLFSFSFLFVVVVVERCLS